MRAHGTSSDSFRQVRPKSWGRGLFCLAAISALGLSLGISQMPPQQNGGLPGPGRTSQGFPALPEDANPHPDGIRALQDAMKTQDNFKRIEELNVLRHKEMTSDTAKLLALANEVKAETDKASSEASMTDVQKVEQIEKLAHAVQQKMKATVAN